MRMSMSMSMSRSMRMMMIHDDDDDGDDGCPKDPQARRSNTYSSAVVLFEAGTRFFASPTNLRIQTVTLAPSVHGNTVKQLVSEMLQGRGLQLGLHRRKTNINIRCFVVIKISKKCWFTCPV